MGRDWQYGNRGIGGAAGSAGVGRAFRKAGFGTWREKDFSERAGGLRKPAGRNPGVLLPCLFRWFGKARNGQRAYHPGQHGKAGVYVGEGGHLGRHAGEHLRNPLMCLGGRRIGGVRSRAVPCGRCIRRFQTDPKAWAFTGGSGGSLRQEGAGGEGRAYALPVCGGEQGRVFAGNPSLPFFKFRRQNSDWDILR